MNSAYTRCLPDSIGESKEDTVSTFRESVKRAGELTEIYGSLRFKGGISFNGETGIHDAASRMGIKGALPISPGIDAIMHLEVGVGLVGNKTTIRFSGDPGGATGEVDNIFTSRLGYAGIKTKFGQFTWGKQWSVYSDIGGWTDNFNAFGADASGTYSARTDGSASGSGRPSNCFQYRLYLDFMEVGIQAQNRNLTDSNQAFADTYGASLVLKTNFGLKFGAAYDKVRDGISNPDAGKPKFGDEAWVAGAFYYSARITATFTGCRFMNHEIDDLRNYFSGYGLELYSEFRFPKKWSVYGGFNYLQPEDGSPAGEFRIQYLDIGSAYRFGRTSKVFIEIRLDDSRNHDGSIPDLSTVGFGMFYEFSY